MTTVLGVSNSRDGVGQDARADLAAALAAIAIRAGAERTAAAAAGVLAAGAARGALVHLQRSALEPGTVAALKDHKDLLSELREAVASGAPLNPGSHIAASIEARMYIHAERILRLVAASQVFSGF